MNIYNWPHIIEYIQLTIYNWLYDYIDSQMAIDYINSQMTIYKWLYTIEYIQLAIYNWL